MMKEYRFDPPSKMIKVVEGATIKVNLFGKRVAFSAYGSVTSLNGEPETGLLVEVQGQENCEHLQEEATTEENGSFRIRGLQPTVRHLFPFFFFRILSNLIYLKLFKKIKNCLFFHIVYLCIPSETER